MGKVTFTARDSSDRLGRMTVNTSGVPGETTGLALEAALSAIVSGNIGRTVSYTVSDPEPRGGGEGLRGVKAVIKWYAENEGSGQYGSNEMPCATASGFSNVGGKLVLQGLKYTAIKTAFDGLVKTENGNSVSVYEVELLTR